MASGEQGMSLFGLESMEPNEQLVAIVAPGSREAVLCAQNISLMALALGCASGANWKKDMISAMDITLTSTVKILQMLLRSNEGAASQRKYSLKMIPRSLREFAAEGPSADSSRVRLQEALKFFRMVIELFQWDRTHKNVFPWAVRLTHGLVRELLMTVDVPDASKISGCVCVLALSERVLRRVYCLSPESHPVQQRRQELPTATAAKPLHEEGSAEREGSMTRAQKTDEHEVDAKDESASDQRQQTRVGAHLSGPWLLLYNYTSTACRKLFKKTSGYSLQALHEGRKGTPPEQQLVTLLCQIQEKLQEFGVKIPSHSSVEKGGVTGKPFQCCFSGPLLVGVTCEGDDMT